jgi:hypothetical protein
MLLVDYPYPAVLDKAAGGNREGVKSEKEKNEES